MMLLFYIMGAVIRERFTVFYPRKNIYPHNDKTFLFGALI